MDKDSEKYKSVREGIAEKLCFEEVNGSKYGTYLWGALSEKGKETYREIASEILDIEGIAILSDDDNLLGKWVRFTRLATNADEQDEFFNLPLSSTNFRRII